MTKNKNLRLCGGTFFTLLLQARKPRMGVRKHFMGESDGLSDPAMLIGLIKILVPDYTAPTTSMMGTFKGNTSDFKTCKISSSTYLPFKDSSTLNAFDNRIKTDYHSALYAMEEFISVFIDAGTSAKKDVYLVKALLELINIDDSIEGKQYFYTCEDGSMVTKSDLLGASEFCLQSFLLGIWHFVLLNRKDNKVGQETYESWCPSRGGAERIYTAALGECITKPINVYICEVKEPRVEAEIVDDVPSEECNGPKSQANSEEDASLTTQQVINNSIVFNQNGNNNIQIGNIGTLTINNN